jgi:hypothetical protein
MLGLGQIIHHFISWFDGKTEELYLWLGSGD